ncbi:cytochrome c biogenesis CcdA family protein [Corynebacterium sputi]|uniref:cytochrome c biogenesis CcdA family protein n=1 Tax=Corynebacterium sputi TaxID=489915 RepID=UPI0003FE213C|nr:cytochrome c biogenesis CcdA family protein [Corynebacterium sputi]
MEISLVAAFIGGTLALLSPCSALLLPAFFASSVGSNLRLLTHGSVFYLGLALTLVPFGLGIGALGSLFIEQRGPIIAVTSLVLLGLGVLQVLGLGFDPAAAVPGADRVRAGAAATSGYVRTFLLGAVGGVAGFCAGPILGAVLTLALAQGSSFTAGVMLAVYGAGMVVPMILIAALWGRLGERGRQILRGRSFTVFGQELHTTSVVTGLLIIAVGMLFWFTNGLIGLPSLIPMDVQMWVQGQGAVLSSPVYDILAVVLLAIIALVVWFRRSVRTQRA